MGQPSVRKKSAAVTDDEPHPGINHNGGPPLVSVAPIPRHAAALDDLAASVGLRDRRSTRSAARAKGRPSSSLGGASIAAWRTSTNG